MGEMEELRKEADNLKEQITVSLDQHIANYIMMDRLGR